eukprot:gnl/MRDRNA2_/MRDRNA2_15126_c0_seq1.p1 gnl/MRDRNA2_/MRDRNA2_15126_c0~~gnl/MRDRNA2_/MRDRNA2_15126_c0_seq1.p1  ORF type:complete len:172 (+),score=43.07 gnl/MRDRNA2_/MRDRNA2_15126_c0_seq1:55-570(+)
MAYHPMGYEQVLASLTSKSSGKSIADLVDLFHSMAYDNTKEIANGQTKHSTKKFAMDVVKEWKTWMPEGSISKVTLGIPFYGRKMTSIGEAKTAQELINANPGQKTRDDLDGFFFNNVATVQQKVRFAKKQGLAGVMIWELGQDLPVEHDHSLLRAIGQTVQSDHVGSDEL